MRYIYIFIWVISIKNVKLGMVEDAYNLNFWRVRYKVYEFKVWVGYKVNYVLKKWRKIKRGRRRKGRGGGEKGRKGTGGKGKGRGGKGRGGEERGGRKKERKIGYLFGVDVGVIIDKFFFSVYKNVNWG